MSLLMILFLISATEVKPLGDYDTLKVRTSAQTTSEEEEVNLQYTFGTDAYSAGFNKGSISTNMLEEQINTSNGTLELKIKLLSLPMRGNKDYDLYLTYRGSPLSIPGMQVNRMDLGDMSPPRRCMKYGYDHPTVEHLKESIYDHGDTNSYLVTADMGNCGLGWNVMPGEVSLNSDKLGRYPVSGANSMTCGPDEATMRTGGFINLNGQSYSIYSLSQSPSRTWHVKGQRNWKFEIYKLYTPGYIYESDFRVCYPNPNGFELDSKRELNPITKITDRNGNYVNIDWWSDDSPPEARIPKKICTPTDTCFIYGSSIPVDTSERMKENGHPYGYCLWDFYVVDSVVRYVNGDTYKVNFHYHQEWFRMIREYWYGNAFVLLDSVEFLKNGDRIKPPYRFKYDTCSTYGTFITECNIYEDWYSTYTSEIDNKHRQGELIEVVTPDSAKYEYFYEDKIYGRADGPACNSPDYEDPPGYDPESRYYHPVLSKYRVVTGKIVTLPDADHIESLDGNNTCRYSYHFGESVGPNNVEWWGSTSPYICMVGNVCWHRSYFPIYDNCRIEMPNTGSITYYNIDSAYVDNLLEINGRSWLMWNGHEWVNFLNGSLQEDIILPFEREEFYGRPYKIVTSNRRNLGPGYNFRLKAEHFYWTISEEIPPSSYDMRYPLHPFLRYKAVQLNPNDDNIDVTEKAYVYHYPEYDQYDNNKIIRFLGEETLTGTSSYTMEFEDDKRKNQSWDISGMPEWTDDPSDNWEGRKFYAYERIGSYANDYLYNLVDTTYKYDHNRNLVQMAAFEYDVNSLSGVTGTPPMHGNAPYAKRGNLTKKTEWINEDSTRSQEYWYDECGNLDTLKDYMGEKHQFEYGSEYVFPDIVTYPDGSKEDFDFDKKGNLTSVTDKSGIVNEFEYDIYGRISEVRKGVPGNMETLVEYSYDDFKRKASEKTWIDFFTNDTKIYSYDALGRLINFEKCAPDAVVMDYIYNFDGKLFKETLPRFSDVSLNDADYTIKTFDGLSRVTEIEYPKSSSEDGAEFVTYEYDGDITDVIDEMEDTTTLINDASGNLIEVIDALDNETYYDYDVNGNLLEIIDAEGRHTNFEYDWLGNLIRREGPDRGENTFEYYPDGNVRLTVQNSGDSILYDYDELGRITIKGGPGQYDPPPVSIMDTLFYDTERHDIIPWYQSSTEWEVNVDISQWRFVNLRYIVKCDFVYTGGVDPHEVSGICSLYVDFEDPVCTLKREFVIYEGYPGCDVWGYAKNIFSQGFDTEDYGNIISSVRMKHTGEALGEFPDCTYPCFNWADSIKNLTVEVGILDSLPYTVLGDTLEEYFYDNYTIKETIYSPPSGLTYSQGRLTGFQNENVREVYFYDELGNLGEKMVIPFKADNVVARGFKYSYDLQGRLTKLEYPSHKAEYGYDKLGNISSVRIINNHTATVSLSSTAGGLLSGVHFPGGVLDTFTYLPRNWMDSINVVGVSSPYNVKFEYNNRGELLNEKTNNITTAAYTYDALGRLKTEDREGIENDHSFTTYDKVGNRKIVDGNEYTYYDDIIKTNRLKNDGFNEYEYNDVGCIKSKSDVNDTVNFYYDSEGRLTGLCDEDGNGYKYYYKGHQRIREEKLSDIDFEVESYEYSCEVKYNNLTGGILEAVFLDGNNNEIEDSLLEEISGTNDWMKLSGNIPEDNFPSGTVNLKLRVRRESGSGTLFVGDISIDKLWGDGISENIDKAYNYFYDNAGNLIMVEEEGSGDPPTGYFYAGNRLLAKVEGYGNDYFYHLNRIGSPIMITDESGNEVKQKKYEAFGNLVWEDGTHDDNREFTGKEKDPTGFHYFGARRYYANIGRFLSPDPISIHPFLLDLNHPQTLNPYVYSHNDPVNYLDPLGLWETHAEQDEHGWICVVDDPITVIGHRGHFDAYTWWSGYQFFYGSHMQGQMESTDRSVYFWNALSDFNDPVPQPGESWESYYKRFYEEYSAYMKVSEAIGIWGIPGTMVFLKQYAFTELGKNMAYTAIGNPSWAGRIGGKLVLQGSYKAWEVTGFAGQVFKGAGAASLGITLFSTSYRVGLKSRAWINWSLANRVYEE